MNIDWQLDVWKKFVAVINAYDGTIGGKLAGIILFQLFMDLVGQVLTGLRLVIHHCGGINVCGWLQQLLKMLLQL